jgi:predicted signal transduction protein with EAL and GGDEF domain
VLEIAGGEGIEGRSQHVEELARRLHELRRLGVGLALDGLGGASAPLSELRRLPVDIIRLERGLVDGITESAFLRTLATSVLRLGRELGLVTVAEGVDQPAQAALLRELGCRQAQGLLFSGPVEQQYLDALLLGPGFALHPSGDTRTEPRQLCRDRPHNGSDQQTRPYAPAFGAHLGMGPHDETAVPPA